MRLSAMFLLLVLLPGCAGLSLRLPEEYRQEKLKEDPPLGREEEPRP